MAKKTIYKLKKELLGIKEGGLLTYFSDHFFITKEKMPNGQTTVLPEDLILMLPEWFEEVKKEKKNGKK